MAFTAIENIAFVVIVVSLIKMGVLLVKPQAWMNFAKWLWSKSIVMMTGSLILAGVVLYYLIQSGITIVEVLAVTAFVALLLAVGLAAHAKDLIKTYEGQIKKRTFWSKDGTWFYALLWLVLIVWGIKEILM